MDSINPGFDLSSLFPSPVTSPMPYGASLDFWTDWPANSDTNMSGKCSHLHVFMTALRCNYYNHNYSPCPRNATEINHYDTVTRVDVRSSTGVWNGLVEIYSSLWGFWWAGRSGDRTPVGTRFSAPVQTGPGAHPASWKIGTGSFPVVKCGRGVLLTTHRPSSAAVMEE